MALINCPECGKQVSDKSNVCIHCGYPFEFCNDLQIKKIQLKTHQIPFTLECFDSTRTVSSRYVINDINYHIADENILIDVEGRKTYQRQDVRWSIDELQWTLISPDGTSYEGTEFLNRLTPGDYFTFRIEDLILFDGIYTLKFKMF